MITRERLKEILTPFISTTTFFIFIFLAAWYANGRGLAKFDLSQLQTFYLTIAGVNVAGHTVNSVFNSPRGASPHDGR